MLGKCLKHEFRATARQLVPLLIAQLAVSLAAGIFLGFALRGAGDGRSSAFSGFAVMISAFLMFAMVALLIAVSVVAFVMIIRRFYTSFFTDEGYLTFTLPVTPTEHIFSKFITAYVCQILVSIVAIVSIFIVLFFALLIGGNIMATQDATVSVILSDIFDEMLRGLQAEAGDWFLPILIVLFVVNMIVAVAASVFMVYLAISVACMLAKKHRVILGIVSFYVINMVFSTASQLLQSVLILVTPSVGVGMLLSLGVSSVICIVQAILCYLGTKWVLTKKLNLD